MKFGEPVLYVENGATYNAIIISSRQQDDHSGEDGEPLVSLAFFKQIEAPDSTKKKPKFVNIAGTSRESDLVQFRHDVAHDSHEYDDDVRSTKGYPKSYPGGRWSEVPNANFTGRQSVLKQ